MTPIQCTDCGAGYSSEDDSCAERFNRLLALDHSRREPWGSRHGQAFAVFALQHPSRFASSLDTAWAALYRIYVRNERPTDVFASLRRGSTEAVPGRPARITPPSVTIADLGDFAAESYAARLDDWCIATLRAYGQPTMLPAPEASG